MYLNTVRSKVTCKSRKVNFAVCPKNVTIERNCLDGPTE